MRSWRKTIEFFGDKIKKGLVQMLGANALNKIITMVSGMVITRVLSKEVYGEWSIVLNIYSYFNLVSALGLTNGAFQFGAENQKTSKEYDYCSYCLRKGILINAVLVLFGLIYANIHEFSITGTGIFLAIYIPMLMLEYFMNSLLVILRCENRIKEYARVLNINTVLFAVGTCGGAFFGIIGVITGRYIAYTTSILILIRKMRPELNKIRKAESLSKLETVALWKFSLISCLSAAMNSLLYLIDVTMVTNLMVSAEQTAVYKVATIIPNSLNFIPSSIMVVILPTLIANNKNDKWLKSHIPKYYFALGALNAFVLLISIVGAPLIIRIISGNKYVSSVPPFRILMIGYAISSTFRIMSANILFGMKKVSVNMLVNIIAGLSDIALNMYMIPKHGMNGAAIATVLSEIIASILAFGAVLYYIYLRRVRE